MRDNNADYNGPIDYSQDYGILNDYIDNGAGQTYPVDEVPPVVTPSPNVPTNSTIQYENFALGEIIPQYIDNFAYIDKTSVGAKFVSILGNRKMYMGGALRLDLNLSEYSTESIAVAGAGRDTLILSNDILTSITVLLPIDGGEFNPLPDPTTPTTPIPPLPVYAFLRTENLTNQNLNAPGLIKGDVVVYFCNTSYFNINNLVNCDTITLLIKEDALYNGRLASSSVKTFNLTNVNKAVLFSQTLLATNQSFQPPVRVVYTINAGNGYIVA